MRQDDVGIRKEEVSPRNETFEMEDFRGNSQGVGTLWTLRAVGIPHLFFPHLAFPGQEMEGADLPPPATIEGHLGLAQGQASNYFRLLVITNTCTQQGPFLKPPVLCKT